MYIYNGRMRPHDITVLLSPCRSISVNVYGNRFKLNVSGHVFGSFLRTMDQANNV